MTELFRSMSSLRVKLIWKIPMLTHDALLYSAADSIFACLKPKTWSKYLKFSLIDLFCRVQYLVSNPVSLCEKFNTLFPESHVQCYGETPFSVLKEVAEKAGVTRGDYLYELGCGRGRGAFWFSHFVGCKVLGIDINPIFVHRANRVRRWFSLHRVNFDQAFMHGVELKHASVIYLYGTCLHDDYIDLMMQGFSNVLPGTKIITVSYSLLQYGAEGAYILDSEFTARFSWGKAQIYIHRKC